MGPLVISWKTYPWRWFLGITLLIRLVFAFFIFPWMWEGDAGEYVSVASVWLEEEPGDFYWPPGLPALLVAIFSVGGITKGSSLFLMLGGWIVWVGIMRLALGSKLPKWKWRGLWVFGIWPAWIHHSVLPLTHLWVAVCVLLIIYLLKNNTGVVGHLLAGTSLLLAVFLRPACMILFPGIIGYLLWKKHGYRRIISVSIAPLIGILIWQFFVHQKTGETFFINKASTYNFYLGNHPETPMYKTWWLGSHAEDWEQFPLFQAEADSVNKLPSIDRQTAFRTLSIKYIVEQPGKFVLRTLNRVRVFWAFDSFAGAWWYPKNKYLGLTVLGLEALCYFAIIGGSILHWKPTSDWGVLQQLSLICILLYGLPYFLAFSHPTYHFAIMPLFLFMGEWNKKASMSLTKWLILFLCIGIQLEWIYHMSSSI